MKKSLLLNTTLITASLSLLWAVREPAADLWIWFSDRDAVSASLAEMGIWGPLVLFALFVFQVFLAFIPGQALMVACGYLYGFWGGFLLSWLSLAAGGELAFVLARRYGRDFSERWVSESLLKRWDRLAHGQGIGFFTISLFMPFMPNDAMCYVAGMGEISHRRFSIANLLGRAVACAFTSAAGAFGADVPGQVWAVLFTTIILGVIVYAFVRRNNSCSLPDAMIRAAKDQPA